MLFWDTSAIVALLVREDRSEDVRRILLEDSMVVAASIAALEVSSALWRRRHHQILTLDDHQRAEARFALLSTRWFEVAQSDAVMERAFAVLARHRMRTLDALQLATAISIGERTASMPFVTLDRKLAAAARAEGFPTLP